MTADMINPAIMRREADIKNQRQSYDNGLQGKLTEARASNDAILAKDVRQLRSDFVDIERKMQDRAMERERSQVPQSLLGHGMGE